jgi:hypothetical protein
MWSFAAAGGRSAALAAAAALLVAPPAAADHGGCDGTVVERVVAADPSTYLALLATLGPGDLLQLAAGTYAGGLPLAGLHGEPGRCIVIAGPGPGYGAGPRAVFTGRDCCNTVSLADSSYLVVRDLELDGSGRLGDAVKAESTAAFVHHVTLEGLFIHGHDADQQIVGVNTKCPSWGWAIRNNVIDGAGTGLYLGDSDGEDEFSDGLIEHNLVAGTLGYNLQIKHQNGRATGLGAPAQGVTILRRNVFSKATGAAGGADARPNVLIGHRPLTGPGADDDTVIYGNFFWQNPTEALLQAEGHVILYDNLMVNDSGPAVHFQAHNDVPRRVRVFHNTVVATGVGVQVLAGHPAFEQRVVGNAVFASPALVGGTQLDNTTGAYAAAGSYLANPDGALAGGDRLDLYPLPGALDEPVDTTGLASWPDAGRDFNGALRTASFRGAYAGEGANPGWLPALEIQPPAGLVFADGFESGDTSAWSAAPGA